MPYYIDTEIEDAPEGMGGDGIPTGEEDPDPEFTAFLAMAPQERMEHYKEMAKAAGLHTFGDLWKFYTDKTRNPKPANPLEIQEEGMVKLFELLRDEAARRWMRVGNQENRPWDDIPF